MTERKIVSIGGSWPNGTEYAEPISFRNDFVWTYQALYASDDHGRRTQLAPQRMRELKDFARLWFRNLKAQGNLAGEVARDVLA